MVRELFFESFNNHSPDETLRITLWRDIDAHYTQPGRHYHTLHHLENLAHELIPLKKDFRNWDTVVFALVYHDVIYNSLKSDNEERSASYAVEKLRLISFPTEEIQRCEEMILATRGHALSMDVEINLFTDADLSVLGSGLEDYTLYFRQIRQEYSIYPDIIYMHGRKKVLEHFLAMASIFKTKVFFDKYELQARKNLQFEMDLIQQGGY